LLDYFLHKLDSKNLNLVMTILVKNEGDIIESILELIQNLGLNTLLFMGLIKLLTRNWETKERKEFLFLIYQKGL